MEDSLRRAAEDVVSPDQCERQMQCLEQGIASLCMGPVDESGELEGFLLCSHCGDEAAHCRKSLTASGYRFCFCALRQRLVDQLGAKLKPSAESRA